VTEIIFDGGKSDQLSAIKVPRQCLLVLLVQTC
jgi:hypothetical protein